mmetsp:Transcript_56780/g.101281  ORF Transcript_56780/g.101281 Transcript_56780/m.101281 type:complete len:415 (-) Transcript_56780:77-1321(-)
MAPLRRLSSFGRMDSIMGQIDSWFFKDEDFAEQVDRFVDEVSFAFQVDNINGGETDKDRRSGWYVFSPDDPDERREDQRSRAHRRRELHLRFVDLFEVELQKLISKKRFSEEQLKEVLQLSREEEVRTGKHFHRWNDATDYLIFLSMAQASFQSKKVATFSLLKFKGKSGRAFEAPFRASVFLRDSIRTRMEEARVAYWRRKELRPLLDKWDLDDVQQLLEVLQEPECPQPDTTARLERKFLVRWGAKLLKEQQEGNGTTGRDVMTVYLGRFVERHSNAEFDHFMRFLHRHVDGLTLSETSRRRRMAWALFHALDDTSKGLLKWNKALRFLQRNPLERFKSDEWDTITSWWAAKIQQDDVDPDPPELMVHNDQVLEVGLEDFVDFIGDLLHDVEFDEYAQIVGGWTALKQNLDL